jgi:hypothetical protein
MEGAPNHNTIAFVRRASLALEKWWQDSDELHRECIDLVVQSELTSALNLHG